MLVGITMVVGTAASLWQMSRAIDERNAKDAALRQATRAQSEAIAAKQKVEQFAEDLVRANELVVSGQAHADAGRWTNALQDFEAAVSMQPAYYLPRVQRAQLYTRIGLWPEAGSDYAIAMNKIIVVKSTRFSAPESLILGVRGSYFPSTQYSYPLPTCKI